MKKTHLKNIDLNLLVIFEAVYSAGNISRAAERLSMSQSAVSNSLARLREIIDDPLFVRLQRGVEPTSKARGMIAPVREALGLIGREIGANEEIDLASYKRVFRIILIDALEPIMMPAVVRTIQSHAPGVEIECVQAHPRFTEDIKEGTIDLACFAFPIDTTDIVLKTICPVDIVVVSRRNHPAIKKPLDFETFKQLPQIALTREMRGLSNIDKTLVAKETYRRMPYMVAKIWSIPPLVKRTDLIGMLPRRFAQEIADDFDLDIHESPVDLPEQHMYMMWHVNNEHDPGHKWLRESMLRSMQTNR